MISEYRKAYLKEYHKGWHQRNKERLLASNLRVQAIRVLGGACVQCQCTDIRCLQIDHIIPIGKKREHRDVLYKRVIRGNTENLQVLCACCHAIKTYGS
jgi:hypothetical protein